MSIVIAFRGNKRIRDTFNELANKLNLRKEHLFNDVVLEYAKNNKDKVIKSDLDYLRDEKRKLLLDEKRDNLRENNYCNYIIKNAYKVILVQALYFKLNSGDVDMNIIKETINKYIEVWEYFPNKTKKNLLPQIKALEQLKDKKFLLDKMRVFRILSQNVKMIK